MSFDLSVHPEVEQGVLDAVAYYRDHASLQVAADFLETYDAAVLAILDEPYLYPVLLKIYRRKNLSRFPYSVFFSLRNSEVRILALSHQRREPFYWLGRE